MASNPFLDAINFNIPQSTQSNFDPNAFAQSLMSGMHGADLSSMQPTWNTSPDFIRAMANSGTASAPNLPSSMSQPSSGGSLWDHIKNGAGVVYNDLRGGLEGYWNGRMENSANPFAGLIPSFIHGAQYVNPSEMANSTDTLFKGLLHPGQAHAQYQDFVNRSNQAVDQMYQMPLIKATQPSWMKGVSKFENNFISSGLTDPFTYTPLPIGKAAELLGVTKALSKGAQVAKDSALGQKVANSSVVQQLGKNFVKYFGASPETKAALQNRENMMNFYKENIRQELQQMAQRHALTPEEMSIFPHVWEGTQTTTNPKVLNAIGELRDFLENGRGNIAGQVGTNAELATKLNGQPILQRLRENYLPHSYNEDEATVQKILEGTPTKSFSTTGPFNQQRQFNTLQEALDAGLTPELNPYVAVGNRMVQSAHALSNAHLFNDLLDKGLISGEEVPGMVRSNVLNSLNWLDNNKAAPVRYFVNPNDETAFKQALQPYEPKGAFTNLFDKAVGAWKWGTLMNPAVHGHNIFYNGMYLGGASPKDFTEAFKSIKNNPLNDEMYQRALKAGAVSADRLSGKDAFKKAIESAQKVPTSNPFQKVLSGAKYASHDVLWDADKALRTTLFKQAVDSGMSDAEAAKRVNKFMVNYNDTTPFENKYLTRAFPFYRWMKGNLPLQAEQWINNTPKQLRYEVLKNMTSNGLSGQNSKDGKINTGIHLPDGSNVMLDPYSPADEPLKMFRDGPLAFLYSKVSPLAKEPVAQTLNQAYYPGSTGTALAPDGKQDMTQSRITTPGAGVVNNTEARINHAASQLLPLSGVLGSILGARDNLSSALGQPTKDKPGETPTEAISRILGGFTSRDNPTLDQYYEQKQQQDELQQYLKWSKKQGITVPSALTKTAYKKIPYPQTP